MENWGTTMSILGKMIWRMGWLLVAMNKVYKVIAVRSMFTNHKEPYMVDRPL